MHTFVEDGKNSFNIGVYRSGWRLSQTKISWREGSCTRPCDLGAGERLPFDVFIFCPPVDVDDVARDLFHGDSPSSRRPAAAGLRLYVKPPAQWGGCLIPLQNGREYMVLGRCSQNGDKGRRVGYDRTIRGQKGRVSGRVVNRRTRRPKDVVQATAMDKLRIEEADGELGSEYERVCSLVLDAI